MIKKVTLELDDKQALDLRSLLDSFFEYQTQLGFGEGSTRVALAKKLLLQLPQSIPESHDFNSLGLEIGKN